MIVDRKKRNASVSHVTYYDNVDLNVECPEFLKRFCLSIKISLTPLKHAPLVWFACEGFVWQSCDIGSLIIIITVTWTL